MSPLPALRPDLVELAGYHSPQVVAEVRLNTNESPYPPPDSWRAELERELAALPFHRYPDRRAVRLRTELAALHGVTPDEVFCANGSNEVLQCLLLAYGGPGRRVVTFEPTYALHAHISRLTGTEVVSGDRGADFLIDAESAAGLVGAARPAVTFACSPNNPTGGAEPMTTVRRLLAAAPGLVVVDEAYGQFAPRSALELFGARGAYGAPSTLGTPEPAGAASEAQALVVVRTFSKTWAMAAARLGYLVADAEVVAACEQVALPYHLSAMTQAAGLAALRFRPEMEARVARVAEERGRLRAALGALPVESWPSDANFVLFRPLDRPAGDVWTGLLERSVLVRDCSSWPGLPGCLRVSVGTPQENDRFLAALDACLR